MPVDVRVPGDKSLTHRALILAAVARGESRMDGALVSLDTQSTAGCLRALGAEIPPLSEGSVTIRGSGLDGFRAPRRVLDCGNSGTTARLLLGLLAGAGVQAELTGDESLCGRPMRRVTTPLGAAGARFTELGAADHLPVRVDGGPLKPILYDAPHASAQVKSALLLAGLVGRVTARLSEPWLSRDHTERILRAMGAHCESVVRDDGRPGVEFEPPAFLEALDFAVPGDFSSAAFLLARGLLGGTPVRVCGVGVNPTRTGFLDVVRRMGGRIELEAERVVGGEPVSDAVSHGGELRGTVVRGSEIPRLIDEVPVIAVLAATARGETRIEGASELRFKESDRLAALAANLRAIGVEAEEQPDGIAIEGTDAPLRGAVQTYGDHRIAMAFGVLKALPGNDIRIDRPETANVSFPGFWQRLDRLGAVL